MTTLLFALMLAQDIEKASVEGIVVNAVTGEPIRKTHVALFGVVQYSAITGADGKFHIESIKPDEYEPQARRVGFLDADDEDSFEIEAGQHKKDLVIKLTPQGIIAGRVLDEDGDPIPEANVGIERAIRINGRKHMLESSWGPANSEGYFFFGELKPGHYYVKAFQGSGGHGRTWIYDSEDYFGAMDAPLEVQLAAGSEMRNIEIRLKRATVFRVRGKVSKPIADQPALDLRGESGDENYSANVKDGEFEFEGVAPGSYVITTSPFHRNQDGAMTRVQTFCRTPVTVTDHDVESVPVEMTPGPNIEGTIKMEGGGKFAKPPSIQLQVFARNLTVEAKEDGSFGWTNLPPDKNYLVFSAPEGDYVKSIQFNHQPVIDNLLDLRSGADGVLEIVVAPNAATVSATVPGKSNVRIAIWNDSGFCIVLGTDSGDSATFKNLAPGEYRIAAFPKTDPDYAYIPEFRARFDAPKITLGEGANQTVEVKLISKAEVANEIAKLQ